MILRKKWPALALLLLAGLILWPSLVRACGTVGMWISIYQQGERHKALFHMLDCADSYQAPRDDKLLLPVIADALERGDKVAELARAVFFNFNCLYGARREPLYCQVREKIMASGKKVNLAKFRHWWVVTAKSGANLRAKPSLDGAVLTAVKFGMQVEALGKNGDWLEVKPVGPGSVDPRYERVRGYVHRSLLRRY